MDFLEGNSSTVLFDHPHDAHAGKSGLVRMGSGFLSYFLACTVTFIIVVEYWNTNKHQWKKWWRAKHGGKKEEESVVGGLEMIPGPRPLGTFIGNSIQCFPLRKTLYALKHFCEVHGNVIKIYGSCEPVVILNSPDSIQAMLKTTNFGHIVKAPIVYDLMKPFITNGVLVSRGKFWQSERKILLRSMSFQSLRAYITMLNNHCERFVDCLDKLFQDGQMHTVNEEINASFLEVICEMITGYDINGTAEGLEYHHNFQKWKETIAYRLLYPWFIPNVIWKLNPKAWEADKAIQGMFAFARRRIAEHRKKLAESQAKKQTQSMNNNDSDPETSTEDEDVKRGKNNGKPFRSVLDELVDAGIGDDQIVDEVNTMLFGGHETGASTIHFFCFAMALNPDIQEQCRKEADEVFSDPMHTVNGRLTYEGVGSLKYVERCVLETLRMYPPVWAFLRQLEAPLRIQLKGRPVDIPIGTNIAVCPFIIHRTAEFYPNPDHFDPDRFLPEECAARHAYSYVPFSAGTRNCLGLKFGMIEMKMVAAYLVRNFVIKTTDRVEDVALLPNLTLTPERDYKFIFERRNLSQ